MELHPLDAYLLDGSPPKADAIAAALDDRSDNDVAQPFYRALEMLGPRVADEALMALRIAIAGRTPDDEAIRTLRTQLALARRGDATARAAYLQAVETGS